MTGDSVYLSKLRQYLIDSFGEQDLRTLCFDLGADYENLPAEGKAGKVRELVTHLERTGRILHLVEICCKLRPNVPWKGVLEPIAEASTSPSSGQAECAGVGASNRRLPFGSVNQVTKPAPESDTLPLPRPKPGPAELWEVTIRTVFGDRCQKQCFEKQCIGTYTAFYLRKNACDTPVAVDGGSTNYYVLRAIHQDAKDKRPTVSQVLTNHLAGIYLAWDLPDDAHPIWYCTGGVLRMSRATFAEGSDETIQRQEFEIAVVGGNGFDPPSISTTTKREHPVKNAMVTGAKYSVIFPIDSSKWGRPAGVDLCKLDNIASRGKKVVLVTCYPVRDKEKGESDAKFTDRVNRFLHAAVALTRHWSYSLKVFTAPVSEGEVEFIETELPSTLELGSEIRGIYARSILPGQESRTGFIIRFDLWGVPC